LLITIIFIINNNFILKKKKALDLINGLIAPSQDDLKSIEKYLTLEELEKFKDYTPIATEIPNYWL